MQPNPVRWFEIYVQDMQRAKRFYESVFQTKLERLESDLEIWAFPMSMERSGASGALVKMEGLSSGSNSVIVYFGCEDCAVEEKRVVEYGGKIHKGKFGIGQYGFITLVHDTEGNMFGLHSLS
ncbi:MAG: VOC family protein [Bdellovibrionota bacterium]